MTHRRATPPTGMFVAGLATLAMALGFGPQSLAAPALSMPPVGVAEPAPAAEVNLRTFGAIGDGQPHPVSEWIAAGKYKNLRALQRDYPFVDSLEWSADEAAFQRALRELPPAGGTVRIPPGRYVATAYGWRIDRDHVRLAGAGMRDTTLSTGPKLAEGLVLAPYRHIGWLHGAAQECPFTSDSGALGSDRLRLREPGRAANFTAGELVFIRNGACRFDQDYGEFNEIAGTTPEGDLVLRHPLARDYTLPAFNWAAETAEPFEVPPPGRAGVVRLRTGEGFFDLPKSGVVTVGETLLEIVRREGDTVGFRNPGGANPAAGTVLPAGTKIGKSRSVIKLTRTTRDFRAEGLRIIGRRKALNLANSYESVFVDCDFVRQPDASVQGGLTIDGDGGRFAEFRRCTVRGSVPCGMQFARSFGNITFADCTFAATNVVFSEFCFAGVVERCTLAVPAALGRAVIVGRSCGDLRIENNRIIVSGGALTVFDAPCDIHSQKLDAPGRLVLRNNRITAPARPHSRVFLLRSDRPSDISGNTLNGEPVAPLQAAPAAP